MVLVALETINPATGERVCEYPETSEAEVDGILAAAERAHQQWRGTSFGIRGAALRRAAESLESRKERLGRLMAVEMGRGADARQALGRGARLLLGGQIPEGPGAFYPPSVLADVKPGMPAFFRVRQFVNVKTVYVK